MIRRMKASNNGTVNAVSPWLGLYAMPFWISFERSGASERTSRPSAAATSPERCGPAPSSAIAGRYTFSFGVSRSKRTRKKLASSAFGVQATPSSAAGSSSALRAGPGGRGPIFREVEQPLRVGLRPARGLERALKIELRIPAVGEGRWKGTGTRRVRIRQRIHATRLPSLPRFIRKR